MCEFCDFSKSPWNDVGKDVNNAGDSFAMIKAKENGVTKYNLVTGEKHFYMLNVNYCPLCGEKLTERGD